MAKFGDGGDLVKCSFCGKSQKQVKKLIAGPGVYICDECIDLCNGLPDGGAMPGTEAGGVVSTCSFCSKPHDQVGVLVTGSGVGICGQCLALCNEILRTEAGGEVQPSAGSRPGAPDAVKCSFCGKGPREVEQLVAGPGGVAICGSCVELCAQIVRTGSN